MKLRTYLLKITITVFAFILCSVAIYGQPKTGISHDSVERDAVIYTIADTMPEFPGGIDELQKYLRSNISFAGHAKGIVFVSFTVKKDGHIGDVKIDRGIKKVQGLDEEIISVISAMPNWSIGIEKGKAVNVRITLPLKFSQ